MNAEQFPGQSVGCRVVIVLACDHRCAANAPVRARIGEKKTLALKPQTKGGCDHSLADDGHVVQGVVETEREAHDHQRCTDFHLFIGGEQVVGGEGAVDGGFRQCSLIDFDNGDIHFTGRINALAPETFAIAIERNGKTGGTGHVVRVDVYLDLDAVRKVLAGFVDHHVPAGDQEQPFLAPEEKARGIGQQLLLKEGVYAYGG
jgi:hypothetical protein